MKLKKIPTEKELKEVLKRLNRFRYIYVYELRDGDFIIKDKVLRKAYLTTFSGDKAFSIRYRVEHDLDKVHYMLYDDIKNHNVHYQIDENGGVIFFSSAVVFFSYEPTIEGVSLEKRTFKVDTCKPKKEVYNLTNGFGYANLEYYKDDFTLRFEEEYVEKLNSYEELVKALKICQGYKYVTILSELPKKKVDWCNSVFTGISLENSKEYYSNCDKKLKLTNNTKYPGGEEKEVKKWNTYSLYMNSKRFERYNSFIYKSKYKSDKDHNFIIIYIGNVLFMLHDFEIRELDVIKEGEQLNIEFTYMDNIYITFINGKFSVSCPSIEELKKGKEA